MTLYTFTMAAMLATATNSEIDAKQSACIFLNDKEWKKFEEIMQADDEPTDELQKLMMPTQAEIQSMEPVEVELWIEALEEPLNQAERDRIWNELHLAVIRTQSCLDDADMHAKRIPDLDVRKATRAAIEGAICAAMGGNAYHAAISACLCALARIAGDAYYEYLDARECVQEARVYARIADNLQERLWRDE